ncbi:MAG: hypothetical protein H0U52_01215 [Chloroflexi bacterium]|nr:hypothetical protein [Chloroflexota bacterium]
MISELVPRRKQERLVNFVKALYEDLEADRARLDEEFVRTADFDRMVEDVIDRVQTVRNEDKLGYWAALLAGLSGSGRPGPSDRDRMINTLDRLSKPHLRLLHVIATTNEPPPGLFAGGVSATLSWKMPDIAEDEARQLWSELTIEGVVDGYPAGTMTAQGAGNLVGRLTDRGREFVRMLRLEAGWTDESATRPPLGRRAGRRRAPTTIQAIPLDRPSRNVGRPNEYEVKVAVPDDVGVVEGDQFNFPGIGVVRVTLLHPPITHPNIPADQQAVVLDVESIETSG